MPTAAGYFRRISSQSSKENLCDETLRNRTGTTSSASKIKPKTALGTPLKNTSRSIDSEESLQTSFRTPKRPEGDALSKRRSVTCGSIKQNMNHNEKFIVEVTPNHLSTECPEFDVSEQLHSLRKEKSQLEAQNCNLQVNFAQVKSQLEAVLLFKEVVCACTPVPEARHPSLEIIALVQGENYYTEDFVENLTQERDGLLALVKTLRTQLEPPHSVRSRIFEVICIGFVCQLRSMASSPPQPSESSPNSAARRGV
jgi:hypothetical protein